MPVAKTPEARLNTGMQLKEQSTVDNAEIARTLDEYNAEKRHLACVRARADRKARELSKVVKALRKAADEDKEHPLPTEYDVDAVMDATLLIQDIGKTEGKVSKLAKTLRGMGVPSSLPD